MACGAARAWPRHGPAPGGADRLLWRWRAAVPGTGSLPRAGPSPPRRPPIWARAYKAAYNALADRETADVARQNKADTDPSGATAAINDEVAGAGLRCIGAGDQVPGGGGKE